MDKSEVISGLSREERETFLRTNDLGDDWEFFTLSPTWAAKLERLGYVLAADRQGGWSCKVPRAFLTIRTPKKRELSEKQRANLQAGADARRSTANTVPNRTIS